MYIYYNNDATKKSQLGYNYCKAYYNIQYKNGVITKNFGGILNSSSYIQQNGHSYDYYVRYNDLDIYNASGNTVVVQAGWHPSNIDEGIYVDDIWEFTSYNDYGRATINGQSQWTYDVIDSIYNQPLGTIKDSLYVRKIRYRYGTWNGTTRTYVNGAWQTLYDYNRNGTLPTYFNGSTTHDSNYVYTTRIDLNTNGQDNNILQLEIISSDPDIHANKSGFYYIRDNHTALINGVIYPNNTFSGDYINEYNQQEQNNNITGTIQDSINNLNDKEEERDQWWRNAFNDLFVLNSGDAQSIINDFTANTQLDQYGEINIQRGILETLQGNPQDFIISWRRCNNTKHGL